MATFYVTKWALTLGVCEAPPDARFDYYSGKYLVFDRAFLNPKDYHTTQDAAIVRAEEMRVKKIASLKKQIARLEKMTFPIRKWGEK